MLVRTTAGFAQAALWSPSNAGGFPGAHPGEPGASASEAASAPSSGVAGSFVMDAGKSHFSATVLRNALTKRLESIRSSGIFVKSPELHAAIVGRALDYVLEGLDDHSPIDTDLAKDIFHQARFVVSATHAKVGRVVLTDHKVNISSLQTLIDSIGKLSTFAFLKFAYEARDEKDLLMIIAKDTVRLEQLYKNRNPKTITVAIDSTLSSLLDMRRVSPEALPWAVMVRLLMKGLRSSLSK